MGADYAGSAVGVAAGGGVAERLHALAEYRRGLVASGPLVGWSPWTGPAPGVLPESPFVSQRDALLGCLASGVMVALVVGGNRSGKTEIGRVLPVVYALGREHPVVRRWCLLRGVDPLLIPSGPGRVCMVARSSADSIRYHRPQIARLLPPGQRWRNYGGRGESHVTLGSGAPGELAPEVWFKSAEQGRAGLQGDSFRMVVPDEELTGPDGSECFDELLLRIADEQGRIIHPFTPLEGRTWTYHRYVAARPPGTVVFRMRATDNPHVNRAYLERLYEGLPEAVVRARRDGEFVGMEGAVYTFDPGVHIVDEDDPPEDWPVFVGMDFGFTNPTSIVWAAVGPDRQIRVIASYHGSRQTTAQHAAAIRLIEEGRASEVDKCGGVPDDQAPPDGRPRARGPSRPIRVERRWLDPSAAEASASYRVAGLEFSRARNDWAGGRDAVHHALAFSEGGPALRVLRGRAPDLVRSIASYSYPAERAGHDPSEKPIGRDDHAPDALRYLTAGVQRLMGWEGSAVESS